MHVEDLTRRGGKSCRRQASVNDDVVSNTFYSRMVDTSNISTNERAMFSQLIFHNLCTEVWKQEGLRKQLFVLDKERWRHFVYNR